MSFANYTAFRSSILSWLDVSDLSTSIVDDLIVVGESKINRDAHSKEQETALNGVISAGLLAVPTDYMELKSAYIDGTPTRQLSKVSLSALYSRYPTRSSASKPNVIAREGSNFIFGPYPDSGYTVKGIYYKQMVPLITSLNTLFTGNPDLYLMGVLSEAEAVLGRDPRIMLWESKYQSVLKSVNEADFDEAAGGGLTMRLG